MQELARAVSADPGFESKTNEGAGTFERAPDVFRTDTVALESLREVLHRWLPDASVSATRQLRADGASVVPPDDTPPPVFDQAALLARVVGDAKLVRTLVGKFLEELPGTLEKLRLSLAGPDTKAATVHAHTLKGAAANMAGEWVRQTAAAMEKAGRAGDLAAMQALWPELNERIASLQAAMQAALEDKS